VREDRRESALFEEEYAAALCVGMLENAFVVLLPNCIGETSIPEGLRSRRRFSLRGQIGAGRDSTLSELVEAVTGS